MLAAAQKGKIIVGISAGCACHLDSSSRVLLAIPIGLAWLSQFDWKKNVIEQFEWKKASDFAGVFLPLAAYLAWRYTAMGEGWALLQTALFGRGFLLFDVSVADWTQAFQYAIQHPQGLVYFGIEVFTVLLSVAAALWFLRRDPSNCVV